MPRIHTLGVSRSPTALKPGFWILGTRPRMTGREELGRVVSGAVVGHGCVESLRSRT
ncbi:hypothetical protein BREVUG8_110148 [Brevundimonas sp. G8]|nr:hypothetical protein BREVUG8_110148 [Brevundimonas sp. G8]